MVPERTRVRREPDRGVWVTFEEFLDEQLEPLRRYSRLLTGDRDTAHDVLADALVKVHLRWARIEPLEHRLAYVRSMVTNGYLSDRRRWAARFIRLTASGEVPDAAIPAAQSAVDDRELLDRLLRVLPRHQRAAIVLRYYLDASDQQIAEELHCSVGAVRAYISRGVATLRARRPDDIGTTPALSDPNTVRGNMSGDYR